MGHGRNSRLPCCISPDISSPGAFSDSTKATALCWTGFLNEKARPQRQAPVEINDPRKQLPPAAALAMSPGLHRPDNTSPGRNPIGWMPYCILVLAVGATLTCLNKLQVFGGVIDRTWFNF